MPRHMYFPLPLVIGSIISESQRSDGIRQLESVVSTYSPFAAFIPTVSASFRLERLCEPGGMNVKWKSGYRVAYASSSSRASAAEAFETNTTEKLG